MKLEFSKRKKKFSDIIPGVKKKNARFGIIKWCCCSTKKWKAENYNGKKRNFVKNAYYEELKPINNVDKECIDEHESDSEILQYDNDKASVECEGSDNEE